MSGIWAPSSLIDREALHAPVLGAVDGQSPCMPGRSASPIFLGGGVLTAVSQVGRCYLHLPYLVDGNTHEVITDLAANIASGEHEQGPPRCTPRVPSHIPNSAAPF